LKIYKILIGIVCLALIIGCNKVEPQGSTGTFEPVKYGEEVKTKSFSSQEELLTFITDNSATSYAYPMMARGIAFDEAVAMEAPQATTIAKSAGGEASVGPQPDYSQTNVQVEGVDEADIIKTDGDYIYTISSNVLFIIKAYPGEDAEVVSKIKLASTPESLFIKGNYLAVFGNFYDNDYFRKINFIPTQGMTYVNIYDIKDKEDPTLVEEYKFEGYYFRGRMVDDYMYIVTNTRPEYRPIPMPMVVENDIARPIPINDIYYYSVPYNDPVFVNIHAINLDAPDGVSSKSIVVEGSQNMYMSEDNMYITYTEYINEYELTMDITMGLLEPKLSSADKELIDKIKATDNQVLSRGEKQSKIYAVYQRYIQYLPANEQDALQNEIQDKLKAKLEEYDYFEFTVINKVHVDKDKIEPVANGKVPGSIINQFSLDEYKDVLRIATTVNTRWSSLDNSRTESTNNVYTLDSDLQILDKLEGLAEGESIYSTRFIGDRLYLVTFKQVDPFFVIDLSNPNNIVELGKLKIPGFSRYLHPYDNDIIIGIGRDATDTGRQQGLKISLFDVSDVQNPKEIAKYVTESTYAGSTAEYEHKAFLFSKDKDLLVIPAYSYDYRTGGENYNGAFVFKITKDEITLRGLIDHSQGSNLYYQPAVERSLYIDDLLYTKSIGLLRINKIDDLSRIKNVPLDYSETNIPVY
jgi:inhibitor of cysteine peptidase